MLTPTHLLLAFVIACTAVVYTCILTEPGEIFASWKRFLDSKLNTPKRACNGLGMHPLYKVLVYCEKCIAGQMALWIFLIYNFDYYQHGRWITIIPHVLFIGFTIFSAVAAKKLFNWLNN